MVGYVCSKHPTPLSWPCSTFRPSQTERWSASQPAVGEVLACHAPRKHEGCQIGRQTTAEAGDLVGKTGLVRKQYHFWPAGTGLDAWDVDRLIDLTKNLPPEEVPLADLREIDSVYWFTSVEKPTVRRVVDHLRLIQEVDTSYPIILGPDNRVMDGMHRIARALLDGRAAIMAVRLSVLPEPDHRDCRPEELPY